MKSILKLSKINPHLIVIERQQLLILLIPALLTVSCDKMEQHKTINITVSSIESPTNYASTKSSVTTTADLERSGKFGIAAYVDDAYYDSDKKADFPAGEYFNDEALRSSGNWLLSQPHNWVSDVNTRFWCHHPLDVYGTRSINTPSSPYDHLSFTYSMATPSETNSADKSDDLIFAYASKKYNGSNGDDVNLRFHHALSMIRFCVSTDDATFDTHLKIKNIKLTNIQSGGSCIFTGNGIDSGSFEWTPNGVVRDFGQNYGADFSGATVDGWTKGTYRKGGVDHILYTSENAFFFIPQELNSTVKMIVVFDDDGQEITRTADVYFDLDEQTHQWKADFYYTYKIKATVIGRDISFSLELMSWSDRSEHIFI